MSNDATGSGDPNNSEQPGAGVPPTPPTAPEQPAAPPATPPAAPQPPVAPPAAPQPPVPPQQPAQAQPGAPVYGQPAPPAPGYAQPAPGYAQPGYPAAGQPQYGQQLGYGAPGYGGAPLQPSNITANLWLSVFFSWIPALIFYLVEKDKVAPNYQRANAANLNYQIIVVIAYAAAGLLTIVTFGIGAFLYFLLPIAQLIIGIIHAINVPTQLQSGQEGKFYLAPKWVK